MLHLAEKKNIDIVYMRETEKIYVNMIKKRKKIMKIEQIKIKLSKQLPRRFRTEGGLKPKSRCSQCCSRTRHNYVAHCRDKIIDMMGVKKSRKVLNNIMWI